MTLVSGIGTASIAMAPAPPRWIRLLAALNASDAWPSERGPAISPITSSPLPEFDEIFDRYRGDVYRFCLFQTRDASVAEEVASDVFYRAYLAYEKARPDPDRIVAWLFTIARNLIVDRHRRSKRLVRVVDRILGSSVPNAPPDPGVIAEVHDDIDRLLRALGQLNERDRRLVSLRIGADLSFASVGEMVGMSEQRARAATGRALQRLRARYEEQDD
jgi:RNA polymerase sigma-70 factor (ECF subfamily)